MSMPSPSFVYSLRYAACDTNGSGPSKFHSKLKKFALHFYPESFYFSPTFDLQIFLFLRHYLFCPTAMKCFQILPQLTWIEPESVQGPFQKSLLLLTLVLVLTLLPDCQM